MPIKTQIEEMPVLNLTSMIDVLFLLIIFFVVGTKFNEAEREIDLKVPEASAPGALSAAPEKKMVNVYSDGQVTLDGQVVSLSELTSRLAAARAQYPRLGVLVRGDSDSRFQPIAGVLGACKQAGIEDLGIAIRQARVESKNGLR